MKKILLSIIYIIAWTFFAKAQTLFGTTVYGGSGGGGTINQFLPATNDLTVVKSFESLDAFVPWYTSFIQASNGKLYGMTSNGGRDNVGVIFSYDPVTSTYTKLKDFEYSDGAFPYGSLMQASNGKLYGMTVAGGIYGDGVIFSFDPTASTYTKLMDFGNVNGSLPYGSLVQASNGKLYGMTSTGGTNGSGVIFSFDPSTSTFTKLKDFDETNGGYAYGGSLIQASNGKLYGMTTFGGSGGYGVIFSFDPITSAYTKLKDFDYTYGACPYASLMQASNGNLYGMTASGGTNGAGVIFSFNPSTSAYTKLKDFDYTNGGVPYGSLLQASNGKLYGMTPLGGASDVGVIFSFDPSNSGYVKLSDFDNTNGASPYGSLMQANNGNLYGLTSYGGAGFRGVIFSFDPLSSIYAKLKDFGINEDGRSVYGSLVLASNGKLYGMTNEGGSRDVGVIFSIDPSTFTYTKLKEFNYLDGANPYGSLIQASNGKLYGMTAYGGADDAGVIFSFDPSTSIYTKLKDFDIVNGANPAGRLLQASNGKLYGMTVYGGSSDYGVIFSFDPSTSTYTKVMDFNGTNGSNPYGSLVQKNDGKIYGMTAYGGTNDDGVIFVFDPTGYTFAKLRDFDSANGSHPSGNLVPAKDGKLYGMTVSGGSSDVGVIFSFVPSSTYAKLKDFDSTNGGYPYGSLALAGDGKLYGMTAFGGSIDAGVIFSFDPSTSTYTKLQDFDNTNGANPILASFIETAESGPVPVTLISFSGKNNGSGNLLSWKVENEKNLNYYELQRSIDGQNFKGISQIKAAGNSVYTYDDQIINTALPAYYYRLKSVDFDGNFKHSAIIKMARDHIGKFAAVSPNPFKDRLMVTVETLISGKATFIITDPGGRQLYKEDRQLFAGTNVVTINEVGKLSKGTYLLTIIGLHQTQSIKVVKGN